MCLSGEMGLLFNLLLTPLSPLHSPLFPLHPSAAIYSVGVMSGEMENYLICLQAALACVYQKVQHTTLCAWRWRRLFWFKYISGEMGFRTSISTLAFFPIHPPSVSFLSSISHFPPLSTFPTSHLHCLLLPSLQSTLYIQQHSSSNSNTMWHSKSLYKHTLQVPNITPPHASKNQVHRSIQWYKPQVTGIQQWADFSGTCTYIYVHRYLHCQLV